MCVCDPTNWWHRGTAFSFVRGVSDVISDALRNCHRMRGLALVWGFTSAPQDGDHSGRNQIAMVIIVLSGVSTAKIPLRVSSDAKRTRIGTMTSSIASQNVIKTTDSFSSWGFSRRIFDDIHTRIPLSYSYTHITQKS